MGRHRHFKKAEILEAIQGSYGIISTVAAKLHCNWHTADAWTQKWPETIQALQDEEESKLDYVEGKAIKAIENNDGAMIRFYLATKGKKRGFTYEDKLETDTGSDSAEPIEIINDGPEVDPVPIEEAAANED